MIDEFQDTGSLQNEFVQLLRARIQCALVVVGDFAQGIYRFQGADSAHMHTCSHGPDATDATLRSNYRAHPSLVAHANRLAHEAHGGIAGAVRMRAPPDASHEDPDATPRSRFVATMTTRTWFTRSCSGFATDEPKAASYDAVIS